jgi:hypothetical protein
MGRRGARTFVAMLLSTTAALAVAEAPAGAQQPLSPLGQLLDSLPNPPQAQDLPGAGSVPDVSSVPGAPQIQGVTNSGSAPVTDAAVGGSYSLPFAEPGPSCKHETQGSTSTQGLVGIVCKPAGVSVAVLPTGDNQILYFNGLEAEENFKYSIVTEIGSRAVNDQSRVLSLNFGSPLNSIWNTPNPADGGANGLPYSEYLLNVPAPFDQVFDDPGNAPGALFCSDLVFLANGDLLVPGGTHYYAEPHLPGTNFGVSELEGLKNTRIFNTRTKSWTQVGAMHYGRWYPSLVTLPDGHVFVASGVTKLLKPVYSSHPQDSGTNVRQTETYNPLTARWTYNGNSASRSLPLYPRLHLLPDGKVYYDAGGQTFNPFGQSYDEALWNMAAVYDPHGKSWRNVGVPSGVSVDSSRPLDTALTAGFRGSAFDVMLPLKPPYSSASFLSAGGVLGTSPGAYLANGSSVIDTIDTAHNDSFSSQATAPLHNARWFSSGVLLPTGQVIAFNGANRDDVLGPGTSFPVKQAEMFDPATGRWTPLASSHDPRTYHNSAVLLPTGQVLVGGNAPISTLYGYTQNIPGGFSNDFRDPSFEIYDPPYLHWGVPQPTIDAAPKTLGYGRTFTIQTPQAASIASVVLMRNTAFTHVVDGDQRSVELTVVARSGETLTVAAPPHAAVAPPGPYELFVNERTAKGLIPSHAQQEFIG